LVNCLSDSFIMVFLFVSIQGFKHSLTSSAGILVYSFVSVECLLVQRVNGYITFCQTNIGTVINLHIICSFACVLVSLICILLQVNELYELVMKTETLAQVLPQTVDRLLALESLHKQGNTVFVTLFWEEMTVATKTHHSSLIRADSNLIL